MDSKLSRLSEQLLLAVKQQADTHALREELRSYTSTALRQVLHNDQLRLSFWINVYNAYFLYLRRDLGTEKSSIYRDRLIHFDSFTLSLDEIEHGILRRCRAKYALGYLPSWGFRSVVRTLMVTELDYRIHFALNCGAQSCPPIAFYRPDSIDALLELATAGFLEQETQIDADTYTIHFSRLGLWYLGDFGGRRGIVRIVRQYLDLPEGHWQIRFRDYNWEENLANFA